MLEAAIHLLRLIGGLVGICWTLLIAVVQPDLYVEVLNQIFYESKLTAKKKKKYFTKSEPAMLSWGKCAKQLKAVVRFLHPIKRVELRKFKSAIKFFREIFQVKYSIQERFIMMFPILQLSI
ncbi:unnamed protein product, partial [Allacma fusca]